MNRIIIIDPDFEHIGGHNYTNNLFLSERVTADVLIIAPITLPIDTTVGSTTIIRCLSCNSYAADKTSTISDKHYYQSEFEQLFTQIGIAATDRIVVHTGSNVVLVSLLAALDRLPGKSRPDLHFRILRPEQMDSVSLAAHKQLATLADGGRAFLYSETKAFVHVLSQFGHDGSRVDSFGVPATSAPPVPAEPPVDEVRVAVLGTLRAEKGYDRLASIVQCHRALTKDNPAPPVRYLVHAPVVKNKRLAERVMRIFKTMDVSMDAKLEVKDPSVHAKFLHSCHIVLLPYDPVSYTNRGSSLACDAIANARPIVCQKNCTLEEYIIGGNGIATGTDLDFAAAIVEISEEYERFSSSCVALAGKFLHTIDNCSLLQRLNAT
jgi:hypothetical protein